MYNFGVLSFWRFSTKFKVILKIQISRKCPLFKLKSPIQNLFGILKSVQHESCRAWKVEQLSCWKFFKLLCKIKSNFRNSVLPKFKILELSLNFKLFGQFSYFPLGISSGHQKMIGSSQNFAQLLFWHIFIFYSNFQSNLSFQKECFGRKGDKFQPLFEAVHRRASIGVCQRVNHRFTPS
jgi:hypothetical protein